jgi:ABC-2 type transport system permease protein
MINWRSYGQLTLCRYQEARREPEVIFWVFIFPILLAMGLGIAFRDRPPDKVAIALQENSQARRFQRQLALNPSIQPEILSERDAARALRLGQVTMIVIPGDPVQYRYDPTRPDSLMARSIIDDALQRAAGRQDPVRIKDQTLIEPGGRYIDFLIPGLIGMNLMGGGMWGVGFGLVDMRIRKLLKRFMATPMQKTEFMLAIFTSRLSFMFVEIFLLILFGYLAFGMVVQGSVFSILMVGLFGSMSFSGLGLLVASRAEKIETVTGLMNMVMLPMYVLSGVFFSADRFPRLFQPFIHILPLTALNDTLRSVILEGASLASQAYRLAVLAAWGLVSFLLAQRWFRWS